MLSTARHILPSCLYGAAQPGTISFLQCSKRWFAAGIKEIASVQEYEAELRNLAETGKLGVIDFTAKWCGPCKAIAPVYEQLSKQYPEVNFYKLDIDNKEVEGVVNEQGITGVPTFTFYKGPRKVESFTGARLDLLKETLQKHS